ncbi:1-phosphofructokinase [Anaerosalibacter massiliensis]|uniref:Tagatose-6-phosphate kinase n=1 Tax=Anaerosalibacter massiliensis TaxID=1347392 RepID=A0A9X2S573_9FIRM|nr:1-phosphofructokinase [Anaerosalibacter massiliensis]MCR2044295.1 1-phosphofructokinase [Anaerosalibacter massiliensis]
MIHTVTLNPAIDKTLIVGDLKKGEVNRILDSREDVGGKGINVSKVLKALGTRSISTGILGKDNSKFFLNYLTKSGIDTNFYTISGENRTNIKIVEKNSGIFTDINDKGFEIGMKDLDKFLSYFLFFVKKGDIVVVSGSLPKGVKDSSYGYIIEKLKQKGAKVILDADGKPLLKGIKSIPYAIKPNINELKSIVEIDENDINSILKGGKYLVDNGIKKVLISLGDKGAIYITENNSLFSKSFNVPVKSTVGAGDSMVAALVYAINNKLNDFDTLKLAMACATAKIMTEGTEKPNIDLIKKIEKDVEIKSLL